MSNLLKFQVALDEVGKVAPLLVGSALNDFQVKSEEFINELQESRYIKVPLVGVFSAGKSSLLNVFMQQANILPVDTMPETAVAYELYYGQTECVELFRKGVKVDTKSLDDIKQLATQPGDIAKVYCKSEVIKNLQERGIILVDMPGIGSGIEQHDAAIFNYINSGTAFVLLVDAEQGSLRGSTLSFMRELSKYGLHPAVLVSKVDKKPVKEVQEIVEYVQYQLKTLGNPNPFVGTVCAVNNDLKGFDTYIQSLDSEAVMAKKLGQHFNSIVNGVIEQLQVRVETRMSDVADVEEELRKIEEEIENVKVELPATSSKVDTPEQTTQDVLDNVRRALINSSEDIAQMIVDKAKPEEVEAAILRVVRAEIITSLQVEAEQYSVALGQAVQTSVENLKTIKLGQAFDLEDIIERIAPWLRIALSKLPTQWRVLVDVVFEKLPDILNWIFGRTAEEVLAETQQKVIEICGKELDKALQPVVLDLVTQQQREIQERVQAELVLKMEHVKEGLREKLADATKEKETVEKELIELNAAISHLKGLIFKTV